MDHHADAAVAVGVDGGVIHSVVGAVAGDVDAMAALAAGVDLHAVDLQFRAVAGIDAGAVVAQGGQAAAGDTGRAIAVRIHGGSPVAAGGDGDVAGAQLAAGLHVEAGRVVARGGHAGVADAGLAAVLQQAGADALDGHAVERGAVARTPQVELHAATAAAVADLGVADVETHALHGDGRAAGIDVEVGAVEAADRVAAPRRVHLRRVEVLGEQRGADRGSHQQCQQAVSVRRTDCGGSGRSGTPVRFHDLHLEG
ncbi:hypothetical protein D3C80_1347710 [compost metagenome]